MTKVRLDPQDEYMHPLEAAVNFNESMYFNVFDKQHNLGGWFRLANRPNEGRGEMTCCIYLPDGRVGFMFKRPERRDNNAFEGGGMTFSVVEPFKTLELRYRGKLCILSNPQDMADPSTAFRNNPVVEASIDLRFTGISPMFGGEPVNDDGTPIAQKADEGFARGHYEQHMRGEGQIQVGSESFPIQGLGLRDHSWGPRFWQSIYWYRWLPMAFDEDFAMMVSIVCRKAGELHAGGMVLRNGEYIMIRDARISAQYDANQNQTTLEVWAKTDEREYNVTGRVKSLIPLRNRRHSPDGEELVTRITEGMTEYVCDGKTGYGLSEFLDQIVDDKPVGMDS